MAKKPDPPPVQVHGFCAGCQQHDKRLTLVASHRYRCDACATIDGRPPRAGLETRDPDSGQ